MHAKRGQSARRVRVLKQRLALNKVKIVDSHSFDDVILTADGERFPAQRIVLAKVCKWFEEYFVAHPTKTNETTVIELPENPSGAIKVFLDLIYSRTVNINLENLIPALKMAVYYKADTIANSLRYFVTGAVNDETILGICESMTKLDLDDDAVLIAPRLAEHFAKYLLAKKTGLKGDETEAQFTFTMEQIFNVISPKVLKAILVDKALDDPKLKLTDDEKVGLIDFYANTHSITREEDKESLASIIDWDDIISYRHLVMHDCDWLPDRYYRKLINTVLDKRRRGLNALTKDAAGIEQNVSRWYALSWMKSINDAALTRRGAKPEVNALEFMSTLGGITNFINPLDFGYVRTFQSVKPLFAACCARNFFVSGKYWMAQPANGVDPLLAIDFMGAPFKIESVSIDTTGREKQKYNRGIAHAPKSLGVKVLFKAANDCADINNNAKIATEEVHLTDGVCTDYALRNMQAPASVVAVEFADKTTNGSKLARLKSFDVKGSFIY